MREMEGINKEFNEIVDRLDNTRKVGLIELSKSLTDLASLETKLSLTYTSLTSNPEIGVVEKVEAGKLWEEIRNRIDSEQRKIDALYIARSDLLCVKYADYLDTKQDIYDNRSKIKEFSIELDTHKALINHISDPFARENMEDTIERDKKHIASAEERNERLIAKLSSLEKDCRILLEGGEIKIDLVDTQVVMDEINKAIEATPTAPITAHNYYTPSYNEVIDDKREVKPGSNFWGPVISYDVVPEPSKDLNKDVEQKNELATISVTKDTKEKPVETSVEIPQEAEKTSKEKKPDNYLGVEGLEPLPKELAKKEPAVEKTNNEEETKTADGYLGIEGLEPLPKELTKKEKKESTVENTQTEEETKTADGYLGIEGLEPLPKELTKKEPAVEKTKEVEETTEDENYLGIEGLEALPDKLTESEINVDIGEAEFPDGVVEGRTKKPKDSLFNNVLDTISNASTYLSGISTSIKGKKQKEESRAEQTKMNAPAEEVKKETPAVENENVPIEKPTVQKEESEEKNNLNNTKDEGFEIKLQSDPKEQTVKETPDEETPDEETPDINAETDFLKFLAEQDIHGRSR